jgi:3-dehydroshikimate dehydratase
LKWSICSTGFKDRPIEDVLELAYRLGLKGVEIWDGHLREYIGRNGTIGPLIALLRSYRLAVPAISGYSYFSKSDEERKQSLLEIEKTAGIAAQIGCPLIRTFAGHAPSATSGIPELHQTAVCLRQAAEQAGKHSVKLGLELHNNTYADGIGPTLSLLRTVADPSLRLIFDGFNLYLEKQDQLEALDALYEWVDHVHLKNYVWNWQDGSRSVPTSLFSGDVDNRSLLLKLEEKGYEGFLSLEYFGPEGKACAVRSLEELKM